MSSDNRSLYLFVLLMVVCESGTLAYKSGCSGGYCFVISNISNISEHTVHSNAQQRCQSNGIQLVEIRSNDIHNALINFIRNLYSQGLNGWNILTNGKRSLGNWIRLNGNGYDRITVYEQPDSSYSYGYLKTTASRFDLFASRPTVSKGGFICTGLSDCSGGVTISGQCYKSFSDSLSWYDARNRCLDGEGDLATFDHITTNTGFNALNGSWLSTSTSYWIGIRRESWTWQSSNSDAKYTEWLSGHPLNDLGRENADCLCLSPTEWKWIECGCNQPLPFVCFLGNSTTSNSPLTSTTKTSSTSKVTSSASNTMPYETGGVPSPSSPTTFTSDANNIENLQRSKEFKTGLAVGLGIGIPAIIVIALLAVIVVVLRKRLRQALRSLEAYQKTTLKNSRGTCDPTGDPYESLQPREDGTTNHNGFYQGLDHSTKTDI